MTKIAGSGSESESILRGIDPRIRIRIRTKMSWIRYTGILNECITIVPEDDEEPAMAALLYAKYPR